LIFQTPKPSKNETRKLNPLCDVAAATALLFGIQLTGICILPMDTPCHYIFRTLLDVAQVGVASAKAKDPKC